MIKTSVIAGIAAAALVGGLAVFIAPSTEVEAGTPSGKGDRLDTQRAKDECSGHAWPYYPANCIRDYRQPTGKASHVRLVFAGQSPNGVTRSPK
jgi:hypothetical protein